MVPKSAYGLSTRQMAAMGITDPDVVQRVGPQDPVRARMMFCTCDKAWPDTTFHLWLCRF